MRLTRILPVGLLVACGLTMGGTTPVRADGGETKPDLPVKKPDYRTDRSTVTTTRDRPQPPSSPSRTEPSSEPASEPEPVTDVVSELPTRVDPPRSFWWDNDGDGGEGCN